MFDRDHAREICNEISACAPGTRYRVVDGDHLEVYAREPLTPEQIELIRDFKPLLLALFTIPPNTGERACYKEHTPIQWVLDDTGIWLCGECVELLKAPVQEIAQEITQELPRVYSVQDYWLKKAV